MKDYMPRPAFLQAAGRGGKKMWQEALCFLAVFFAASLLQGVVIGIVTSVYIFGSEEFLTLFGISALTGEAEVSEMLDAVARLINLVPEGLSLWSLLTTAVPLAAAIVYCTQIERRSLFSMGIIKKRIAWEYLRGFVIGSMLFVAALSLCLACGAVSLSRGTAGFGVLLYLLAFAVQGMSEEILCRSYLMVSVSRRYSLPAAILFNSFMFMMLHIANNALTVTALLNLFLFGVTASLYMIDRGSVWGVGALHTAWNFLQGNIFGVPVSGSVMAWAASGSLLTAAMAMPGLASKVVASRSRLSMVTLWPCLCVTVIVGSFSCGQRSTTVSPK